MLHIGTAKTSTDILPPLYKVEKTGENMLWEESPTRRSPKFYDLMYIKFYTKDKNSVMIPFTEGYTTGFL